MTEIEVRNPTLTVDRKTFAYLLAALDPSAELQAELAGWSHADFLEYLMSAEDQAQEPACLWPLGWDRAAARVAPVQLTLGWDPWPRLRSIMGNLGMQPCFELDPNHAPANPVRFDGLPSRLPGSSGATAQPSTHRDEVRFLQILTATLELACSQGRGVLYAGAWGWSYDIDVFQGNVEVLRRAGMLFLDRHS